MQLVLSQLEGVDNAAGPVEIAERKGIGHPDTICDALAERLSMRLSRHYIERFGRVLHHNVDKALLAAGRSEPRFGGGRTVEPWTLYLAGRAVTQVGDERIPVEDFAAEEVRDFVGQHLPHVDPETDLRVCCLVQQGSSELRALFGREQQAGVAHANDTSFGVGHAPLSPLERLVLDTERMLNGETFRKVHPAGGEDVKVMGVRSGSRVTLTVARALVGRHLPDLAAYLEHRALLHAAVTRLVAERGFEPEVHVNAADDPDAGNVYLTVTGTSAEMGDDGQVGRGNRGNGLITPLRPMSLEALCGKNPVSHVGKLYNLTARRIAEALVAEVDGIAAAECYLVSRIGAPVAEPQLVHLRLRPVAGAALEDLRPAAEALAADHVSRIGQLWAQVVAGEVQTY